MWKKTERKAKGVIFEYILDSILRVMKVKWSAKDILISLNSIDDRTIIPSQSADRIVVNLSEVGSWWVETNSLTDLLSTLPITCEWLIRATEALFNENISLPSSGTRSWTGDNQWKSRDQWESAQ